MKQIYVEDRPGRTTPDISMPEDDFVGPFGTAAGVGVFHETHRPEDDLDAFNRAHVGFDCLPGPSSALDVDIEGVRGGSLSLWRLATRSGFQAVPKTGRPADLVTILMPLQGQVRCDTRLHEHVAGPGFGLLVPEGESGEWTISGDFVSINCAIGRDAIERGLRTLRERGSPEFADFERSADLSLPALRSFRECVSAACRRLADSESRDGVVYAMLEEIVVLQLLGAWPQRPGRPSFVAPSASRQVRRALDFIEANIADPITVADVAAAAGVGVRSLQASFRRDLGRTPVQHIIDRRLERAQEDLRHDGQSSISTIASRWGFVHMSDFSRRYRQRFGCTPSQTQIRAFRSL